MKQIMVNKEHACELLDLSASTFESLVRNGDIKKPRKVAGRTARYLVAELEEFAMSLPESDLLPPQNTSEGGKNSHSVKV